MLNWRMKPLGLGDDGVGTDGGEGASRGAGVGAGVGTGGGGGEVEAFWHGHRQDALYPLLR